MTRERGRPDANQCFVCGPDNAAGLRVAFRMDGDICRAEFVPAPHHAGYDGMAHGGILFSVLDDVMANWLFLQGIRAHTARCEIRFRQPVPLGTRLSLEGRLHKRRGRLAVMQGRALGQPDGALMVEAEGTFMVIDDAQAMPGGGAS
jgi:acyl-coenzyme A thioesterase PaaI-like protein